MPRPFSAHFRARKDSSLDTSNIDSKTRTGSTKRALPLQTEQTIESTPIDSIKNHNSETRNKFIKSVETYSSVTTDYDFVAVEKQTNLSDEHTPPVGDHRAMDFESGVWITQKHTARQVRQGSVNISDRSSRSSRGSAEGGNSNSAVDVSSVSSTNSSRSFSSRDRAMFATPPVVMPPPPAEQKCVTMIIVGAGARGKTYTRYAVENPHLLRVVGCAEPRKFHRELMKRRHDIPAENIYDDWVEIVRRPRFADAVCIATQDNMHVEPAVAFAEKGYHILLEKPMAVSAADCRRIVDAVKRQKSIFAVGHVLRYTPYMQKLKEIIRSGVIGEVINIQHLEPIGNWHFAHSYVRGPWRKEADSTFMLMAKCCHDIDLIRYIIDRPCERVSSFGDLTHFRADKKPRGASDRCLDCAVERNCPYSAKKIYLDRARQGDYGWPVSIILDDEPSAEAIESALRNGPYGRCVWSCDNDVADHQVVNMQFAGGATATLTTAAFTEAICQRRTRIFGSLGELDCDGDSLIRHFDFATRNVVIHEAEGPPPHTSLVGHNGADYYLIESFTRAVATKNPQYVLSGPDETLESHLIVFAAEAARRAGAVVSVKDAIEGRLDGLFPSAPPVWPVLLATSTPTAAGSTSVTYTAGVSVAMPFRGYARNVQADLAPEAETVDIEAAGGRPTKPTVSPEGEEVLPQSTAAQNVAAATLDAARSVPVMVGDQRAMISISSPSNVNSQYNINTQSANTATCVPITLSSAQLSQVLSAASSAMTSGERNSEVSVVPITATVADATLDAVIGATGGGGAPVENVDMSVSRDHPGGVRPVSITSSHTTETPLDFSAVPGSAPSASCVAALVATGLNVARGSATHSRESGRGTDGGASPLHVTEAAEASGAVGVTSSFDEVMEGQPMYSRREDFAHLSMKRLDSDMDEDTAMSED